MDNPFDGLTDDEIAAELVRRSKEREGLRRADWFRHIETVRANLDHWLAMVPTHSRTSCKDGNPCNSERECVRCALLVLRGANWMYGELAEGVYFRISTVKEW